MSAVATRRPPRRPRQVGTTHERRPLPAPLLPAPAIRADLLAWYDATARPLAFRSTRDPWAVLVAESMAQQTQADRAAVAWTAFLERFATPGALAAASPADVIRAWRGLGYNRRATQLRAAAVVIVDAHGGRVPARVEDLERLPGVGPYTARAVAAIAFGMPVGAVDTNVRRVVSRLVGRAPGSLPATTVQALADGLVDPDRPGDWTHAIMDLGATRCRAARADCDGCPLRTACRSAGRATPAGPTGAARRARRASGRGRTPVPPAPPFPTTARWLRGRIVDRLRDEPGDGWVRVDGPIGDHPADTVGEALAALARAGLLERHPDDPALARLPLAAPSTAAGRVP